MSRTDLYETSLFCLMESKNAEGIYSKTNWIFGSWVYTMAAFFVGLLEDVFALLVLSLMVVGFILLSIFAALVTAILYVVGFVCLPFMTLYHYLRGRR